MFCAGHFITYDGHECEPLHGHNYRAAAALEGPLDENAYVFDFTRLKRALRGRRRPPRPPDAAADEERAHPGHPIGRRGPGDVPRQAIRVPRERRGAPAHPQHHRGDAGLVDRPGAQAGPRGAPAGVYGDRGRGGRVLRPAGLLPGGARREARTWASRGVRDVAVDRLPRARLEPGRPPEQPGRGAPEPPRAPPDRADLAGLRDRAGPRDRPAPLPEPRGEGRHRRSSRPSSWPP